MPFSSRCLKCMEQTKHFSYCDFRCSKKNKEKIFLEKITIVSIKKCLENNIGCSVSEANISKYSREILEVLQ